MKKTARFLILSLCMIMIAGMVMPVFAARPYQTYIYDKDGYGMDSPDAFVPDRIITSKEIGMGKDQLNNIPLDSPQDLTVDADMNLYVADTKNNRIVVLNPDGTFKFKLDKFINEWGINDDLTGPKGVFVNDLNIYVADTENNRIVLFDKEGKFERVILEPESDVFPETHIYKPIALAVDMAGRMYVVSSTDNMGVLSINPDGTFQGFIGAQKTSPNAFDIFWRNFQSKEQRKQSIRYVATEYNNIEIDDGGFIYVTTSSIDESAQQSAMNSKSKSGEYAPVKKLNPAGVDIMMRAGFFPPSGEVNVFFMAMGDSTIAGASKIIDVALGPNGTWTIIDEKRQKTFTYDEEGKQLYIFGDQGMQLGNLMSIQSVVYQGTNMLLLDKTANNITVFKRTVYGDIIDQALLNHRERRFDLAVEDWKEILKRNNNFDMAYIGIAKSLYRDAQYTEAMEQYKYAYDTENYSKAFKMYRKEWIEKYVIVIPIFIIVVVVLASLFTKHTNKVNKRDQMHKGKKLKLGSHMLYGFHIIFHPFDGYWDMKHEKRGGMGAATIYLLLACAAFIFKALGTGYIFNPFGLYTDFTAEAIGVIVPVLLWTLANWCLTTLFDGEGSMGDIYMATCYATMPITLVMIPTTLLSNVLIEPEGPILAMVETIAFAWLGFLIFFGSMVIHDYSLGKNVLTSVASIVGMAFIMFVGVLFSSLMAKIVSFISQIYVEISYRI